MDHHDARDRLLSAAARLAGHRHQLAAARDALVGRAKEQYNTGQRAERVASEAMERGNEAGPLGARFIRARSHENERLRAVLMDDSPLDGGAES